VTGARLLRDSHANAAGRRRYRLFVPSSYRGEPVPLLVMLHGGSQTAEDFADVTRMSDHAQEHGFLAVYPEQDPGSNPGRYWNWFEPAHQVREAGEPSILAGITRQVMSDYAVDLGRVYVAGFSSGGAMAAILATTYPDLYAAVGVHSGLPFAAARDLSSALTAMSQGPGQPDRQVRARANHSATRHEVLPLIVFHGDRDTVVAPTNADALTRRALDSLREAHGGLRAPYRRVTSSGLAPGGHTFTCTTYRDDTGRRVVEQWTVHGAVHAWSGGTPVGSYSDPRGPDASAEIVRFFLEQARLQQPPHVA
jgi:poly(hydroxyalkanoate) depolymerase family esterase